MKTLKKIKGRKFLLFCITSLLLISCEKKFEYSYDNFKSFRVDKPVILNLDIFVSSPESKCACNEGDLFRYYEDIFEKKSALPFSKFLYLAFNQQIILDCKQLGINFKLDEAIRKDYGKLGFNKFKEKYYDSVNKKLIVRRNNFKFLSVQYIFFINNYTFVYKKEGTILNLVKVTDLINPDGFDIY